MPFITLTTDFGLKDHAVASIKGAIYSLVPNCTIVDISHQITPFNILETGYILQNTYKNFPKGTIHVIGVDAEFSPTRKHLCLEMEGQYFIGADNGVFSMIFKEFTTAKIVEINIHDRIETQFNSLNVFVNVAAHLAKGGQMEVIGKPVSSFENMVGLQPVINATHINGNVIYIDNFGNAVTNISKAVFSEFVQNKEFTVYANGYQFNKLVTRYNEVLERKAESEALGDKLLLFNSNDYLEIAIYKSNLNTVGGASTLLGLDYWSAITVEIK